MDPLYFKWSNRAEITRGMRTEVGFLNAELRQRESSPGARAPHSRGPRGVGRVGLAELVLGMGATLAHLLRADTHPQAPH